MKLSNAYEGLAKENHFLRQVTIGLLVLSTLLLGVVYSLYDRLPMMFERSARGLEIVAPTPFMRRSDDLKAAITLMVKARFESTVIAPEIFINPKQIVLRDTEQKEMKARGMSQSIVVRTVEVSKDQAVVDLDRVIAVGEIRSALRAKIRVSFEETTPTELNPYGLLLSVAEPIEQKEKSR